MENFDIAKYLKEHKLGPYGMLGGYVDLHTIREEEQAGPKKLDMKKDLGWLWGDLWELTDSLLTLNKIKKDSPNHWDSEAIEAYKYENVDGLMKLQTIIDMRDHFYGDLVDKKDYSTFKGREGEDNDGDKITQFKNTPKEVFDKAIKQFGEDPSKYKEA